MCLKLAQVLLDHFQYGKINVCSSSLKSILPVIPCRCILGPFIFIVYIASLSVHVSHSKLLSFDSLEISTQSTQFYSASVTIIGILNELTG